MTHDLTIERRLPASPEIVYGTFLDMYGERRPDWILSSKLDLRVGGRWTVVFRPPGLPEFGEDRVLSAVEPGRRLAYTMTTVHDGQPGFSTEVELRFDPAQGDPDRFDPAQAGTALTLTQRGFPDTAARDDFAGGWSGVWDFMAQEVAAR
jgi:uncharacterized protein YndB with AHSA1/START domain